MPPPTAAPCRAETARGAEPSAGHGTGGVPCSPLPGRRVAALFPNRQREGHRRCPSPVFRFVPPPRRGGGSGFLPDPAGTSFAPRRTPRPPGYRRRREGFWRSAPQDPGIFTNTAGQSPARGRRRTEARTVSPSLSYSYSTTLAHEVRNSRSSGLRFTSWDAATMGIHFCTYWRAVSLFRQYRQRYCSASSVIPRRQ